MLVRKIIIDFSPQFLPGSGILGRAGKAAWAIGRRDIVILRLKADRPRCEARLFQKPDTTAWMQEVEQRMEQLPRTGCKLNTIVYESKCIEFQLFHNQTCPPGENRGLRLG
jgi:hypothetical protein